MSTSRLAGVQLANDPSLRWLQRPACNLPDTAANMQMHRPMTAVVLVTDLVGSTHQRCLLGEELADKLIEHHGGIVGRTISRWGGWLVKGTGDGGLAAFDAACQAVGAAVELRSELARYSASSDAVDELHARYGLAAGDVTWTIVANRPDCNGLAVIEAARLCDAAGADEILASDLVRRLACGRGSFEYQPLPPIELSGFVAPVLANRVEDPRMDPADDPDRSSAQAPLGQSLNEPRGGSVQPPSGQGTVERNE